MTTFPGSNFVGGGWTNGFGLHFTPQGDGWLTATYTFDSLKQGPPGIVHGGALASVLDEAMTAAVFEAGYPSFTVNLILDYRVAVQVGVPVTIQGKVDLIDRRKLYTIARVVLEDGTQAVEAKALFITQRKVDAES
jgi:acyl-coenzyme A thioesterase PaaI-like protein